MKSRKPLVVGNWKMNGDVASNEALLASLAQRITPALSSRVDVAVCPPYPYIGQAAARLAGTGILWGAQDLADADNGALTGAVSAAMLSDLRCHWVIVGHSERRALFGESDALVASKTARALAAGLLPIVCVGESLAERESGTTTQVIERQAAAVISVLRDVSPAAYVMAYEPVWAIGTGRTATPEQAQEVHAAIRAQLAAADGIRDAQAVRLLYGGSVKAANAAALMAMPDVDGGLIGGAALSADEFTAIVTAAAGSTS